MKGLTMLALTAAMIAPALAAHGQSMSSSAPNAAQMRIDQTNRFVESRNVYDFYMANPEPDNPLSLGSDDIFWELVEVDGNQFIDLSIRKRNQYVNSVMLIRPPQDATCADIPRQGPLIENMVDYGLRANYYNPVNGNEQRFYMDEMIGGREDGLYFLVDSSTEENRIFQDVFRIRIPQFVNYGYQEYGANHFGVIRMDEGALVVLRTFIRPNADYRGQYVNNCFVIGPLGGEPTQSSTFELKEEPVYYLPSRGSQVEWFETDQIGNQTYTRIRVRFHGITRAIDQFTAYDEPAVGQIDASGRTVSTDLSQNEGGITWFSREEPNWNRDFAILLESRYDNGRTLVRADIYLRHRAVERSVVINVRDVSGITSQNVLRYRVPPENLVGAAFIPDPDNEEVTLTPRQIEEAATTAPRRNLVPDTFDRDWVTDDPRF